MASQRRGQSVVRARMPPPLMAAFRRASKTTGLNQSELVRTLLSMGLATIDRWPQPPADVE